MFDGIQSYLLLGAQLNYLSHFLFSLPEYLDIGRFSFFSSYTSYRTSLKQKLEHKWWLCQNSRSLRSGHKLRHTFLKCWKAKLHLKNIMNSILTMVLKFSNYAVPHFFLCLEYMMGMNDMIYQNQLSNNIKSVVSVFEKLFCTTLRSFFYLLTVSSSRSSKSLPRPELWQKLHVCQDHLCCPNI